MSYPLIIICYDSAYNQKHLKSFSRGIKCSAKKIYIKYLKEDEKLVAYFFDYQQIQEADYANYNY